MSEQTPDSTQDATDGTEPSMEDILASIRKIIADDVVDEAATGAVGVAMSAEPREVLKPVLADDSRAAEVVSSNALSIDEESDFEIDAMIAGLDDAGLDNAAHNATDIEIPVMLDDDAVLDLEIPFADDEPVAAMSLSPKLEEVSDMALDTGPSAPMDGELSLMLDSMVSEDGPAVESQEALSLLETLDVDETPEALEDVPIIEDIIEDEFIAEGEEALDFMPSQGQSDMDLVKSLMADLTEKPYSMDDVEVEIEVPEINVSEIESSELDVDVDVDVELEESLAALTTDDDLEDDDLEDENSVDVMDEILNMTLYDEVNLHEETIASEPEAELEVELLEAELDISEFETLEPVEDVAAPLSLQDIAEAAQTEASALEGGAGLAALGGGLALGAATAKPDDVDSLLSRLDNIIETPEIEDDVVQTIEISNPVTPTEETTPMPRAVKSETIIDEVTETATAGAFASLNQAVEEKATVAERGDRIGDLVMESLRPMLKEWLDANLKGIVERAVTKEVKRISSGK